MDTDSKFRRALIFRPTAARLNSKDLDLDLTFRFKFYKKIQDLDLDSVLRIIEISIYKTIIIHTTTRFP